MQPKLKLEGKYMKKTIMALALIVSVLVGGIMLPNAKDDDRPDLNLVDETYYALEGYHNASEGSIERSSDENTAYQYLKVKTVLGQEKATEYYNTVISTADLGTEFDRRASNELARTMIREYRAAVAAEQRPMPTPLPAPSLAPEGEYQTYPDVANDAWYAEAVNAMSSGGLLKGYDDGLFHPNDLITYAQWSVLMCRVAGVVDAAESRTSSRHWASGYSEEASMHGFHYGGAASLDEPLTRGVALNGLYNGVKYDTVGFEEKLAAQYAGKVWTPENIPDYQIIKDNECRMNGGGDPDWQFWSTDDIVQTYNLGITQGVDSAGTCNPMGGLTRAEAAQMFYNIGITKEGGIHLGRSYVGSSSSGASTK